MIWTGELYNQVNYSNIFTYEKLFKLNYLNATLKIGTLNKYKLHCK